MLALSSQTPLESFDRLTISSGCRERMYRHHRHQIVVIATCIPVIIEVAGQLLFRGLASCAPQSMATA